VLWNQKETDTGFLLFARMAASYNNANNMTSGVPTVQIRMEPV